MFPMDRRDTPVTVEYTARGRRVSKRFASARIAKLFYVAKSKAGADPKVVGDRPVSTVCKACGGTGVSSNGRSCYPCQVARRIS
jgi:hypothetical protein